MQVTIKVLNMPDFRVDLSGEEFERLVAGKVVIDQADLIKRVAEAVETAVGEEVKTAVGRKDIGDALNGALDEAIKDLDPRDTMKEMLRGKIDDECCTEIDRQVENALDKIDFGDAVTEVVADRINGMDMDEMVPDTISNKLDNLDLEDMVKDHLSLVTTQFYKRLLALVKELSEEGVVKWS